MKHALLIKIGAALLIAAGGASMSQLAHAQPSGRLLARADLVRPASLSQMADAVRRDGSVNLIVDLNVRGRVLEPEGDMSAAQVRQQRAQIALAQQALALELTGTNSEVYREYESIPTAAVRVDGAGLAALAASEWVAQLSEDLRLNKALHQSAPLVEAPQVWQSGYDGRGQTIVVIDDGIDRSHAFFKNSRNQSRLVAEACFSNGPGKLGEQSLCPSGAKTQIGPGAANVRTSQCQDGALCDHGTHVAGIAAGYGTARKGVAPGASIAAIQVFTRHNTAAACSPDPSPCTTAYFSDILAGLDHVNSVLKHSNSVASVNMSLGGGAFTAACDSFIPGIKFAIDNLRSSRIASVIATGNEAYINAIGFPSCISSSVAVSATDKLDEIPLFANLSKDMDLYAPGLSISSAKVGGGYVSWQGTSMATPHVAGAWALLKQANPSASVTEVLQALKNTGKPISFSDPRIPTLVKPRIRIKRALDQLKSSSPVIFEDRFERR